MATFDYVIFENTKVTFPSNLVLIFSAIRHNSSALFLAQTLYTLVTRSQLKSIFGCLSQNSLNSSFQFWNENSSFQFKNDKSIPLQILHYFSMSWHIIHLEILRSHFSTLDRRIPSKSQFWHFFPTFWRIPSKSQFWHIKVPILTICQISHVIFQTTGQFFFKIYITLQSDER